MPAGKGNEIPKKANEKRDAKANEKRDTKGKEKDTKKANK